MGFLFLILHAPVGNFYGIQCGWNICHN